MLGCPVHGMMIIPNRLDNIWLILMVNLWLMMGNNNLVGG